MGDAEVSHEPAMHRTALHAHCAVFVISGRVPAYLSAWAFCIALEPCISQCDKKLAPLAAGRAVSRANWDAGANAHGNRVAVA